MSEKPKFFFEADTQPELVLPEQEHADTFFSALKATGVIQDLPSEDMEAKKVEADASMNKIEDKILSIEFGTYQDNYAIHVTPIHPTKNLKDEHAVKRALKELVVTLNQYVPRDLEVALFLPKSDWAMKVISATIKNGAKAWNLNVRRLEEEGIPRIFEAIEKVILS